MPGLCDHAGQGGTWPGVTVSAKGPHINTDQTETTGKYVLLSSATVSAKPGTTKY